MHAGGRRSDAASEQGPLKGLTADTRLKLMLAFWLKSLLAGQAHCGLNTFLFALFRLASWRLGGIDLTS